MNNRVIDFILILINFIGLEVAILWLPYNLDITLFIIVLIGLCNILSAGFRLIGDI